MEEKYHCEDCEQFINKGKMYDDENESDFAKEMHRKWGECKDRATVHSKAPICETFVKRKSLVGSLISKIKDA